MPRPKYQPFCEANCRSDTDQDPNCRSDTDQDPRPATEWIYIDNRTMYVCATCARNLFGLPSPATAARRRKREMERLQEVLPNA